VCIEREKYIKRKKKRKPFKYERWRKNPIKKKYA
jgi:hypothetical protein